MSTNPKPESSASGSTGDARNKSKFDDCIPAHVSVTKVMDASMVTDVWSKIYAAAGIKSGSEEEKRSLRCAVYMYIALNGSSPSGSYSGTIRSGRGAQVPAAVLPASTGRLEIRQFMRANASESIEFFQATRALELDPVIRAKSETMKVPLSAALAFVDYLDAAIGLTPAERDAQQIIRNYSLQRASYARGGRTVDEMRHEGHQEQLEAQISRPHIPPVNHGGF